MELWCVSRRAKNEAARIAACVAGMRNKRWGKCVAVNGGNCVRTQAARNPAPSSLSVVRHIQQPGARDRWPPAHYALSNACMRHPLNTAGFFWAKRGTRTSTPSTLVVVVCGVTHDWRRVWSRPLPHMHLIKGGHTPRETNSRCLRTPHQCPEEKGPTVPCPPVNLHEHFTRVMCGSFWEQPRGHRPSMSISEIKVWCAGVNETHPQKHGCFRGGVSTGHHTPVVPEILKKEPDLKFKNRFFFLRSGS